MLLLLLARSRYRRQRRERQRRERPHLRLRLCAGTLRGSDRTRGARAGDLSWHRSRPCPQQQRGHRARRRQVRVPGNFGVQTQYELLQPRTPVLELTVPIVQLFPFGAGDVLLAISLVKSR